MELQPGMPKVVSPNFRRPFASDHSLRFIEGSYDGKNSRRPIQGPSDHRDAVVNSAALLLSRLQFAFTISFHIIFPSFTIGLAAWLTVLDALHLKAGGQEYM